MQFLGHCCGGYHLYPVPSRKLAARKPWKFQWLEDVGFPFLGWLIFMGYLDFRECNFIWAVVTSSPWLFAIRRIFPAQYIYIYKLQGIILPSYIGIITSRYKDPYWFGRPLISSIRNAPERWTIMNLRSMGWVLLTRLGFWWTRFVPNERKSPSRWWFQIFFIFTPIWGRFPIWLIFFKRVQTTN